MTQGLNKSRRKLLIALCYLPFTGWLKTSRSAPDLDYALASSLTNIFQDRSSAKMIGMLYLEAKPNEAGIKQLLNRILHQHPGLERLAQDNHTSLSKRIRALQNEDFEKERVVSLDGWILSRTEARLCALTNFI